MNNIKLFMLLIMAATSSVALAQETTSYEFETEDNTLVIEAKGDLTTYSDNTNHVVFTSDAVGNVFTSAEDESGVATGDSYFQSQTYYSRTLVTGKKQLFDGGMPTTAGGYMSQVRTDGYTWNSTKVSANNTYIYEAHIDAQQGWNASNTYLYEIEGAPTTADFWTTSALTAANVYVYPVTYDQTAKWYSAGKKMYPIDNITTSYAWNVEKVTAENVFIYNAEVKWDGQKSYIDIGERITTAAAPNLEQTNYGVDWYYKYYISNTEVNGDLDYDETNKAKLATTSDQIESYCDKINHVTISGSDITGTNISNYIGNNITIGGITYAPAVATTNTYNSGDVVDASNVTLILDSERSNYQANYLAINASRLTAGEYTEPGVFTFNNNEYANYILSISAINENVSYPISEVGNHNITLLTSALLNAYHGTATTVTVKGDCITTGTDRGLSNETFTYDNDSDGNNETYVKYITSPVELADGATPSVNDVTLLTSVDNYRSTNYIVYMDAARITGGYYTAPTYYYDANVIHTGQTWSVYYALSTEALQTGTAYPLEDSRITVLNQTQIVEYLDPVYKYTPAHIWDSNNDLNKVYKSTDGGNTKTLLDNGTEYTYSDGDLFYTDGYDYEAINNATYFGTNGAGASYIKDQSSNFTFAKALLAEMVANGSNYTKVKFVNKSTASPKTALTINPEIVQQILFPNSNANNTITELDLGEATTTSFYCLLSHPIDTWKYPANLASCTLPLTTAVNGIMTLPPSSTETIGEEVKEIDVIPSIYLNKNLTTVTVPVGYTNIAASAFYGDSWLTTVNLPEGLKEIGDNAFENCTSLQFINNAGGRSIVFPSTLATIGESAFVGTSLTSTAIDPFILPSGLKKVKKSAFQDLTSLEFLQLNEGLEYVGNTAFGLHAATSEQATITFPSTLKYLGPGSFINRWYQDVYFTGKTAPVCPVGKPAYSDWGNVTAFSVNTQMGNNGFNPIGAESGSTVAEGSTAGDASKGYANRENYINNSAYYFTILHFPEGLTNDQAKTYRDITRRYVTGTFDENGAFNYAGYGADIHDATDPDTKATYGSVFKEKVDGTVSSLVYYMSSGGLLNVYTNSAHVQPGFIDTYLGAQQVWPSQSQWIRNFVTVANGVEWDGVTVYEPAVTDEELQKMFEWMKEDGLFVQANSLDYTGGNPRVPNSNDNSQGGVEFSLANKANYASLSTPEKAYFKLILYQGTRRFVLSYDGGYSIPFKVKLKGGRWWSICLPFNMTKKEVNEVFGNGTAGTHVCLMSAVDRSVTNNSTDGNTLVLKFKNDVYRHKTERKVTKDATGYAYTYASNFSKSNTAPADDDIVIYARESYMIYPIRDDNDPVDYNFGTPVFETGDPLPTIVYSNSDAPYTTQNGTDPAYRFIGNFTTSTGNDNQGKAITIKIPQYSYAYGRENAQATQSKFFILSKAGATWSPFKSLVQNTAVGGGLNDWNNFFQQNTARVNQVSLFGDDEEVTGIDNVIIEVSSDNDEDLRVFNLNGSMMGNSLQGLPAGTYIQGGKAYRVK